MTSTSPPHPPPLPEAAGALIDAPADSLWAWLHRNRHATVPAFLPVAALIVAVAVRIADAAQYVLPAAVAVVAMTAFFARFKWDRPVEVLYAILSAVCACGWLAFAAVAGIGRTALITLAALSLAWGIPYWRHKRPRPKVDNAALIAEWDEWWQHHAPGWGLGGSKVTGITFKGPMETLVVQLWRGRQSVRDVDNIAHLIESALDGYVRHGMVRVRVNPLNPSQALIRLRRENPLAKNMDWDPSLVPASATGPAPIGVSESGEPILTPLLANWFIIGRSRSGKSNELSEFLATLTGVPDARTWLIDMKGGRAARPWLPALDWCAVTIEEARLMLRVAAAETGARSMHAYDGHEQLQPTQEVPALCIVIDETHEVTSTTRGDTECANLLEPIASMGMGVAVYVIILTQYGALEESVRTEQVRLNLSHRMCFQVEEQRHGAFALSDFAALDASKLEHPGEFYWKRGPRAASEPGRGHEMSHDLVREIAARNSQVKRPSLLLYASGYQGTYDARWTRLPGAFRKLAPQAQAVTAASPPDTQEAPVDIPRSNGDEIRADAEMRAQRIEDEVAEVHASGRTEPPKVDDLALRRKINQQKAEFARALQEAPEAGISPARLMEVTGMPRSTLNAHLTALTSDGAVIKVGRGAYRAAAGMDVAEAMEKIRKGDDRLLAKA